MTRSSKARTARTAQAVTVERVHDEPSGGTRARVDGLWPRGLTRDTAHPDPWLKAIVPSAELRTR